MRAESLAIRLQNEALRRCACTAHRRSCCRLLGNTGCDQLLWRQAADSPSDASNHPSDPNPVPLSQVLLVGERLSTSSVQLSSARVSRCCHGLGGDILVRLLTSVPRHPVIGDCAAGDLVKVADLMAEADFASSERQPLRLDLKGSSSLACRVGLQRIGRAYG